MSFSLFKQEVTADIAMQTYYVAVNAGNQIADFMVKMKTHTPGLGTLLCTLRYNDGEGPQDLNVSLTLTAGNYAVAPWPNEWLDTTQDIQLQFQYLVPGGTCDVEVQYRNN